jgi:hypothetical protein
MSKYILCKETEEWEISRTADMACDGYSDELIGLK